MIPLIVFLPVVVLALLAVGDDVETHRNTDKSNLTVTPMIRLLLDKGGWLYLQND